MAGRKMRETSGRKLFSLFNVLFLCGLTALCLVPFVNVIAYSFSDVYYIDAGQVTPNISSCRSLTALSG